jgi:hypothetical protein
MKVAVAPPEIARSWRAPKTPNDVDAGIRLDEGRSQPKKTLTAARSATVKPTKLPRIRERADPGDRKKILTAREPNLHRGKAAINEVEVAESRVLGTERTPPGTARRLRYVPLQGESIEKSAITSLEGEESDPPSRLDLERAWMILDLTRSRPLETWTNLPALVAPRIARRF